MSSAIITILFVFVFGFSCYILIKNGIKFIKINKGDLITCEKVYDNYDINRLYIKRELFNSYICFLISLTALMIINSLFILLICIIKRNIYDNIILYLEFYILGFIFIIGIVMAVIFKPKTNF